MTLETEILDAYVRCALWASLDDDGAPLDDRYGAEDLPEETRASMRADVADFLAAISRAHLDTSALDPDQLGHDFWLTRNRHGAGFWDRDLGDLGEALTDLAHDANESDLYVGDDGVLYVAPYRASFYREEVAV